MALSVVVVVVVLVFVWSQSLLMRLCVHLNFIFLSSFLVYYNFLFVQGFFDDTFIISLGFLLILGSGFYSSLSLLVSHINLATSLVTSFFVWSCPSSPPNRVFMDGWVIPSFLSASFNFSLWLLKAWHSIR